MNVAAILKRKGSKVETVKPEETVADAARRMADLDIGALVVCDRWGKVVGIVSERDVARRAAREGGQVLDRPVSAVMVSPVLSCTPEDEVKHVMSVMTLHKVRHLPVMVGGQLRGMVSLGDLVKHRLDEIETEVGVLRDYARSH
ncbi:MAG TPA: CBS domain-containing protein [Alphaproteobacteria bacterium]|jgi:CBS domain-containing protein